MGNNQIYDSSNIKVLTAFEAIQKRPGMYIGDTDALGLANLVLEVLSFYLEGFHKNQCTKISIVIKENNEVEISDNGIGLPVHKFEGKSVIEKWMTELTTAKNQLIIINALSSKVLITIAKDGIKWTQCYINGVPQPIENNGEVDYSGTTIRFLPNK